MADRVFTGVVLALTLGYAYLAFFVVEAPFQYDPLGPETWPQLLGIAMLPCLLVVFARPDTNALDVDRRSTLRLAATVALLIAYAELYEPAGFAFATIAFCTALALLLGARPLRAIGFGVVAGALGYLIGAGLLGLNLPSGPLPRL